MRRGVIVCAAALLLLVPGVAVAAPVLSTEVPAGTGEVASLPGAGPSAKTIDGSIADWHGRAPGFGGSLIYSRGELPYQDLLFDAWGPDAGRDAQRLAVQDPLLEALPETYRIDPALQANLPGEFGLPTPEQLEFSTNYGDLEDADAADLSQFRLAATGKNLFVLARTTTMLADAPVRSEERRVGQECR